ncbi:MAG: histidine kinase [Alphaproteobacteria bacterium]|nr:histidine kinase [Alphaproteobacteria bacterium]
MTGSEPFLVAHASAQNWRDAAGKIIVDLQPVTAAHRLGFLYVSDHFAGQLKEISVFLRQTTGVPHWVGTVGFGVCATGAEYFNEPAMAAMLAPISEDAFRVFSGVTTDLSPLMEEHGDWIDRPIPPVAIVHGDPRNQQLPDLIAEMSTATNGFLVGGLTASNNGFPQLADGVEDGGLSGVMLSLEAVPLQSGLTQGCSPIGPVHTVTESQQNVLIRIDDRPALDVFKEDIGDVLARDLRRVAGYIFAALPVSGSDTGDYMVRNLVGIDPDAGALAIGELIAPGDRIMFCRRDHDSAVEDMRRMLASLKRRVGKGRVRGGLYFSCCGRGPNQFGPGGAELRIVAEELGEFPLVGFFANGEISNNRLYGYTGVLTLFL